jgi:hypothetical protein
MRVYFFAGASGSLVPLLWFGEFNGFTLICIVLMGVGLIGVVRKEGWT